MQTILELLRRLSGETNNKNNNNISSHNRTFSEALEHKRKKNELDHNNNIKMLLNLTNMISNSKDFSDPSLKIYINRELSCAYTCMFSLMLTTISQTLRFLFKLQEKFIGE